MDSDGSFEGRGGGVTTARLRYGRPPVRVILGRTLLRRRSGPGFDSFFRRMAGDTRAHRGGGLWHTRSRFTRPGTYTTYVHPSKSLVKPAGCDDISTTPLSLSCETVKPLAKQSKARARVSVCSLCRPAPTGQRVAAAGICWTIAGWTLEGRVQRAEEERAGRRSTGRLAGGTRRWGIKAIPPWKPRGSARCTPGLSHSERPKYTPDRQAVFFHFELPTLRVAFFKHFFSFTHGHVVFCARTDEGGMRSTKTLTLRLTAAVTGRYASAEEGVL